MDTNLSLGEIIQGGGLLTFAYVIWYEVRQLRIALVEKVALIEERTRLCHARSDGLDTGPVPRYQTGENRE